MKSVSFLLLAAAFFATISIANAQMPSPVGGLDLTPSTNSPVPGQKMTITARSYAIDINSAKITWTVNGVVAKSGVGATILDLEAPALGKTLKINVAATTPEGQNEVGTIMVSSGTIDLIYETNGYVPPFFRGKILPAYQNIVKVIAIPHLAGPNGVEFDPKTLVYQWKKNGKVIEDQSGYGKQAVSLPGDIVPRPYDLSVSVWSRDESAHAQTITGVSAVEPSIGFYVDDPLYGPLFNRAITTALNIGSQKETTVLAVPFGFNKQGADDPRLSWIWSVNNAPRGELSSKESVVLRAPGDISGSSNIQLTITNSDKILQGASAFFTTVFSADPTREQNGF